MSSSSSSSSVSTKKKCKIVRRKCKKICATAVGDTRTDLTGGTQTLAADVTVIIGGVTLIIPAGTTLNIIGFQIPTDCAALCPARIRNCAVERVCADPSIVVGGSVDVQATLVPVLQGTASVAVGTVVLGSTFVPVTLLGTPIAVRFSNPFHAIFEDDDLDAAAAGGAGAGGAVAGACFGGKVSNKKHKRSRGSTTTTSDDCCPEQCKLKWEVCDCKLCPGFACFENTSIVTTTPTVPPSVGMTICVARTFHQFDVVKACLKKSKHKVRPPVLTSITPSCVDFILTGGVATDLPRTCVTINGCNLNNVAAVLFNGIVCAEIISINPSSIVIHVPCPVPVISPTGTTPLVSQASVSVVDFCGRQSNAVQLQFVCPTGPGTFSLTQAQGLQCVQCGF